MVWGDIFGTPITNDISEGINKLVVRWYLVQFFQQLFLL